MNTIEKILFTIFIVGFLAWLLPTIFNEIDPWIGIIVTLVAIACFIRIVKWMFWPKTKQKNNKKSKNTN